jgi:hypothetical protein
MDGESPHSFFVEKAGGLQLTELWETRSSPADNSGAKDAADHGRRIEPVDGGSVFRIIEYPPDSVRLAMPDEGEALLRAGDCLVDCNSRFGSTICSELRYERACIATMDLYVTVH